MSFHRITSRALAVGLVAGAMAVTAMPAQAASIGEGFDDITTLTTWQQVNLSEPTGALGWFQGNDGVFPAQAGAATNSYIAANYNNTSGTGTISNWLISPKQSGLTSSDVLDFWTRAVGGSPVYPDRLEVRLSTNGSCNPGTTAAGVGDFTTLVTSINPGLTGDGYPVTWTQYTLPLTSVGAGSASGCFAFRYFVTDGGPSGDYSDYIGIDSLTFTDNADNVAPTVSVTSGPSGKTANAKPTFAFSADEAASFECRITAAGVAAAAFGPCSGPGSTHTPATALGDGSYTFEVRANDGANTAVAARAFQVTAAACATAQSSVTAAQATVTTATATLATAKTALKKAKAQLRKAKKQLKKALASGTASQVAKAKLKVKKAKIKVKRAKAKVAKAQTALTAAQAALAAAQSTATGTCA